MSKSLSSGQPLGRFILLEKLGSGHYGEVWKAKHKESEMQVAIKVLHGEFAKRANLSSLKQEAWILGKLRHKNIVRCLDFSTKNRYLAQDFIDGFSLEEVLVERARNREWLELDSAKNIIRHCLEALDHAHTISVVHGDIKPGNIMMPKLGETQITDWGVSRILGNPGSRLKGSSTFAAPEVLRRWDANENWSGDYQSDLFSLGVVSYLLLSGKHPFLHPSGLLNINEAIKKADYIPEPLEYNGESGIPRNLASVVMRLLEKDLSRRYPNARDALKDLVGEQVISCPQCNHENSRDASYCNACGANLKGEVAAGKTEIEAAYNSSLAVFRSNPEQAIHILKTALQKNRDFAVGWSHLGYMYNSLRMYTEAIEACNQAVNIDSQLSQGYQTRGFAKSNLGMYDDAGADFTKALELTMPDNTRRKAQVLALRAYTYMLSGNHKKACEDATLALRLDPANSRASWLQSIVCK